MIDRYVKPAIGDYSLRSIRTDHRDDPPRLEITPTRRRERHGTRTPMFTNAAGDALHPESISQLFSRLVSRSCLPRIRFHGLRHTHASLLVADRVNIKVVSERLGHAHASFTIHTYQHLIPGMSAHAAHRFAALIDPVDVHRATDVEDDQLNQPRRPQSDDQRLPDR